MTGARFALTARRDSGNEAAIEIVLTQLANAANSSWLYFYQFDLSAFSEGGFTTATSSLLSEPTYVLDSANNYNFVGSGSLFAPDLSQIDNVVVQGSGFLNSQAFRYTFDKLEVVPEPASLFAVGAGLAAFAMRHRLRR